MPGYSFGCRDASARGGELDSSEQISFGSVRVNAFLRI